MHECPNCGMICDCDGDDLFSETPPIDCQCDCEDEFDDEDDYDHDEED